MKKIIVFLPVLLLFLVAPVALAGTPFLSSTAIYFNGTFTSGTLVAGSTSVTDGSNTTFRQMSANNSIAGSFGSKKYIDAWTGRTATVGTFPYRLELYAQDGTTVVSTTILSISNTGSSGTFSPKVNAYFFKLTNTHTSTVSLGEFNLQETPDTDAPEPPTLNSATGGNRSVTIQWTKPAAVDLAGYKIYRNGSFLTNITNRDTTTYNDLNLIPKTSYTYSVSAYDDSTPSNESAASSSMSATAGDTSPPTTPTNLTHSFNDNRVTLSWTASSDNYLVSGYRIRQDGVVIGTTTSTSYTINGLTNLTTYVFTVEAYDTMPNYSTAASRSATPYDAFPPLMPTLSSGTIGETTAEITFLDSSSTDNKTYKLSTVKNFLTSVDIPDNNSSSYSYTFTGLASNTTYTFYAMAIDDDDNQSTTAREITITTAAIPPNVPSNLSYTTGDRSLTFSWTQNTESDLLGYKIKSSPSGTPVNTATNSYTLNGLTNGSSYCYQVAAYDTWGNTSDYTTAVCGTPTDSVFPDAPILTATAGNLQITLSWTNPTASDASFFRIYEYASGAYTLIETTADLSTLTKTYSVPYNVSKSYAVATVDDDGNESVKSGVVSATSQDNVPPTPPTSLSASAGDRSVFLSWTASTDNNAVSGYKVVYKIVSDTGETIATTTATNYTATGLTNGSEYNFTVQAYDPAGNLSTAASINATPQDTLAPDMKHLTLVSKTETSVTVTFGDSLATDNDFYTITKDNFTTAAVIDDTNAASYTYTFSGLSGNTDYTFKVYATDDDNRESDRKSLTVRTAADPPATPTGLSVTELDNKLTYTWDNNTEPDLAGYKLYRVSTGEIAVTTSGRTADLTPLINGVQVCYQVAAYDIWGNISDKSPAVCGTPVDLVPPFDVTNIMNTASTEYSYTISWTDSSSPDVDYYKIYKDSIFLENVDDVLAKTTYTYTATGLTPGVTYSFTVNPVDDDGLETFAGTSGTISGMTTGIPPSSPSGFSGTPGTDKVSFTWSANTESDLEGYKLYKVVSGSYSLVNTYLVPTTAAEIATMDATPAVYVLAAYDTGGSISGYSSSVTVAPVLSTSPPFKGTDPVIGANDVVQSGFGLFGILAPILLIFLAVWLVAKLIPTVKHAANGKPGTDTPKETQTEPVKKRKRTKKEIETDRKIKKEISEEKRRIEKVKSGVRKKLSATLGYRIYKKD